MIKNGNLEGPLILKRCFYYFISDFCKVSSLHQNQNLPSFPWYSDYYYYYSNNAILLKTSVLSGGYLPVCVYEFHPKCFKMDQAACTAQLNQKFLQEHSIFSP